MSANPDQVYLSRKIHFSSAHRYYLPDWSEEKNQAVFGPCANPFGHGHNYDLEVTVFGPVDPKTGMVINLVDLDAILDQKIMTPLDHRYLNHEVEFFQSRVPTTENIILFCWQELEGCFQAPMKLFKLKLYENPELFVEYYGPNSPLL